MRQRHSFSLSKKTLLALLENADKTGTPLGSSDIIATPSDKTGTHNDTVGATPPISLTSRAEWSLIESHLPAPSQEWFPLPRSRSPERSVRWTAIIRRSNARERERFPRTFISSDDVESEEKLLSEVKNLTLSVPSPQRLKNGDSSYRAPEDIGPPSGASSSVPPPRAPEEADVPPPRAPEEAGVPPPRAPEEAGVPPPRAPEEAGVPPPRAPEEAGVPPPRAPEEAGVPPPRAPEEAGVPPPRAPEELALPPPSIHDNILSPVFDTISTSCPPDKDSLLPDVEDILYPDVEETSPPFFCTSDEDMLASLCDSEDITSLYCTPEESFFDGPISQDLDYEGTSPIFGTPDNYMSDIVETSPI